VRVGNRRNSQFTPGAVISAAPKLLPPTNAYDISDAPVKIALLR